MFLVRGTGLRFASGLLSLAGLLLLVGSSAIAKGGITLKCARISGRQS